MLDSNVLFILQNNPEPSHVLRQRKSFLFENMKISPFNFIIVKEMYFVVIKLKILIFNYLKILC